MSRPTARTTCQDGPPPVARWVVAAAIGGTIAVGAFWPGFTALTDLAARAGIDPAQGWVWPLIVDGIIVVATIPVVALSPYGRRATWYPWSLLAAGAIVSIAGNAAHAVVAADSTLPRLLAAAIAAVAPAVVRAVTHLTVELTSRTRPAVTSRVASSTTVNGTGAPARRERARQRREAGWSNKRIARQLGVHPSTVGRWLTDLTQPEPAPPDGPHAPAGTDMTRSPDVAQGAAHGH